MTTPPALDDLVERLPAGFTPGPWRTTLGNRSISWNGAVIWSGETKIATITRPADKSIDQKAADARLIALAPEMADTITRQAQEIERLREDAERFRALMRCPRIKMQGSAGVDWKNGGRTYPDQPGRVHFGAEFWCDAPSQHVQDEPTWGRHALRALADDILAVEARALLKETSRG